MIQGGISNYVPYKVWDEITYPFPNFNGCTVEIWKRISNFVPHITEHMFTYPWWRHQMETFSALLALCAGNSPVPGEFPSQRPVTRGFDVFFDLPPNKRLSKQSWGWWFETLSCSLWRHCNVISNSDISNYQWLRLCLLWLYDVFQRHFSK